MDKLLQSSDAAQLTHERGAVDSDSRERENKRKCDRGTEEHDDQVRKKSGEEDEWDSQNAVYEKVR